MGSDIDVARLIISVDLKRFVGKLSFIISISFWDFLFGQSVRDHMEVWDYEGPPGL